MKFKIGLVSILTTACILTTGCNTSGPQAISSAPSPLGQPELALNYTLRDYDSHGKLIYQVTRPAHSYVQAFLQMFYSQATQVTFSMIDTGNTARTTGVLANAFTVSAGISITTYGIVAGTSNTAVTESDYKIGSLIASGAGSGQLSYSNVSVTLPVTVNGTISFTTSRTLSNSSGSTITINEIGLYCATGSTYYFCLVHDIIAGGQTVQTGHTLTITYTIAVTI
jgi:hypothetical protein